jgi:hypothetical protein
MPTEIVSIAEIDLLIDRIIQAADQTVVSIRDLLDNGRRQNRCAGMSKILRRFVAQFVDRMDGIFLSL